MTRPVPQGLSHVWEAWGRQVPCAPSLPYQLNSRPRHPMATGELGLRGVARAALDWKVSLVSPVAPNLRHYSQE